MTTIQLKEITAVDNGARFLNVDLHIHSFGGSADVSDAGMTPEAIVNTARTLGLSVIAITDHNSHKNVESTIECARQFAGELLVIAGVEITTSNGHLLAYFSPDRVDDLNRFIAKLDLVGVPGANNTHTSKSMADVISEAERLGGICIAAHIDREKTGFEAFAPGYQSWKNDIIINPGLYGLECDSIEALAWYSEGDDSGSTGTERKKIFEARSRRTEARRDLAHLQGSDAHSMADFKCAQLDGQWTRMKLTDLTWSAFRTALVDPEARVRAKAVVPRSFPRIRGISIEGGFLDGSIIQFSDNLNSFIGGRGTGKSTAIRALSYAFGINDEFAEYDNCPDRVVVYAEDANGVPYRYERARGSKPLVKAKFDAQTISDVPTDAFRIEYFGQGELAEIAKDPLSTPQLLQLFLDRHTYLSDLIQKESSLIIELRENAARLHPIEVSFGQLKDKRAALAAIDTKLKIAEEGKLRDIVSTQSKIASEKAICESIEEAIKVYRNGLTLVSFERSYAQMAETAGELTGDLGCNELIESIKLTLEATNTLLRKTSAEVTEAMTRQANELTLHKEALGTIHAKMQLALAGQISELKAKGLAGNIVELEGLLRQKSVLVREIGTIEQRRPALNVAREERDRLRSSLADVREQMTTRRKEQLRSINANLARTIKDYTIFVQYDKVGITDEFYAFVKDKMTGTYLQDQLIRQLCERVTPSDLAELILKSDAPRVALETGISSEWASQIVAKLRFLQNIYDLQVLSKPPRPIISVKTKSTPAKSIPIVQLSDGQRHTILLTIAILADSNIPLIIDQPEDDLDNAFIFTSIVTTLRAVKEKRQVILVTHNANIAVLGDSELLLPMNRENDCGMVTERGSIDRDGTKLIVQNILEGGPAAFARRREIYGY